MHYRQAGWMGALAAVCAVQLACGGAVEDARYDPADTDQPGMFEEATRQVQVTGCVERGIIPGSFMLTNVRTDETETRGTTGTMAEGESAVGSGEPAPEGMGARAAEGSYTLRAVDGRNLGDYIGQRVAVEGTLMTNQAHDDRTVGAAGMAREGEDPTARAEPYGARAGPTGASMPMQQLAAENIERVEGACGTGGNAESGGDAPREP